jgi:hypothetical protein
MNTAKKIQYSGGHWRDLHQETDHIRNAYINGRLTEVEKHKHADRLHEIAGSLRTADVLIPKIAEQHRRSVTWAMERTLVAAELLTGLPHISQAQRDSLTERVHGVLRLIDNEELEQAEAELRKLDAESTELRMSALDSQVERLLAGIGAAYATR